MRREYLVRIEPGFIRAGLLKDEHAVCWSGRKVHQLVRQVRALIELVDSHILCHIAADRHVFFRGHVPRCREPHPRPRLILRVTVRRIQEPRIRTGPLKVVDQILLYVIAIKADTGPARYGVVLPPPARKAPEHEASMIFRVVPVALRHPRVFLRRLGRPYRNAEPVF